MADQPENNEIPIKQLRFQGRALEDLKAMPDAVRGGFGHALWEIQNGLTPTNASPFERSAANEVMNLTERHDGDTYRCVYAAKFEQAIYVLHVFYKEKQKRHCHAETRDRFGLQSFGTSESRLLLLPSRRRPQRPVRKKRNDEPCKRK